MNFDINHQLYQGWPYRMAAIFEKKQCKTIGKFQLFRVFPKVYVFGHIKVNLAIFLGFLAFGIVSSFGVKLTNVPPPPPKKIHINRQFFTIQKGKQMNEHLSMLSCVQNKGFTHTNGKKMLSHKLL